MMTWILVYLLVGFSRGIWGFVSAWKKGHFTDSPWQLLLVAFIVQLIVLTLFWLPILIWLAWEKRYDPFG